MFWAPEAQTVKYDDPAFTVGEVSAHFLSNIVVWAPGNPPGLEERLRKELANIDPNLVVYTVDPYDKVISNEHSWHRQSRHAVQPVSSPW